MLFSKAVTFPSKQKLKVNQDIELVNLLDNVWITVSELRDHSLGDGYSDIQMFVMDMPRYGFSELRIF